MDDCEHDWRRGPLINPMFWQVVCLKCWKHTMMHVVHADKWPKWTEQDYWDNLDVIEGDRAAEIRAAKEKKDECTAER
jgi:hypothetical protein